MALISGMSVVFGRSVEDTLLPPGNTEYAVRPLLWAATGSATFSGEKVPFVVSQGVVVLISKDTLTTRGVYQVQNMACASPRSTGRDTTVLSCR